MKAIAVVPGTKTVRVVDRPEPSIVPDEIKASRGARGHLRHRP